MLSDLMQRNIAAGLILNALIAPDVVAVTMGADNEPHICYFYIQFSNQPGGFSKVGNIGVIN
jgi:hypothetical protein